MKLNRIITSIFLFAQLSFFAQTELKESSRILRSNTTDTAFIHLEMSLADYDIRKKDLPYFTISKATGYDEQAIPILVVKKVIPVEKSHGEAIKKYFSDFISNQFITEKVASLSKNQNLNHYKLFPFRYNALNQLEELVDYDVTWQVSNLNNSVAREAASVSFASASVLANGEWYKIAVTETGIHKLSKAFFNSIGINTANLDPNKIRVFGNGGKMLPERNKDFRYDDLVENSIKVVLSEDGLFDYALFYASSTTEWIKTNSATSLKFKPIKNIYSDTSFYFINVGQEQGKRIASKSSLSQNPDFISNSYDYINYHEEDIINFGKSGREFYGEYFDLTSSYNFSWSDGDFLNDSIYAELTVAALYTDTTTFILNGNGLNFRATTAAIQIGTYSDFASKVTRSGKAINSNSSSIILAVSKLTSKSVGWLDKLTVNARRSLTFRGKQFSFRDSRSKGLGKVCNFSISNTPNSVFTLWNVTDNLNPFEQAYITVGSAINYTCKVDSLNEFCIAPINDYYSPVFVGKIANQNLHAISKANYIIVSHPLFVKEAERLGAFHQQKEGLSYVVATIDQIYNEFGSGKQDISAIRDFIRMIYSRTINLTEDQQLKYVLLMGDGSYDNKNRNVTSNSNLIPTYESKESLDPIRSVISDDFYALMDPNEGANAEEDGNSSVDIGIGRFPCRTLAEVKAVIAKIENYYRKDPNYLENNSAPETRIAVNESPLGDWRTWLLFLGDDEDWATHMKQSDNLVKTVKNITSDYNIDEINLDAYQRFSTPGGNRYPDAASDFLKRIDKGALIFNYTGHGGEVGLTAERMIDMEIINTLNNFNKLPLFITATCEFSRYDDPGRTSAGEACLLNPKGGAIALYTTCRVAYSTFNELINTEVLKRLFTRLPNGKWPTLGDAIALTKAQLTQKYYYANFHLLGDPALTLAYPEEKVITSHFNNVALSPTSSDTIGSLSKITVKGFVADKGGKKLSNFNGIIYPTVFDKEQTIVCLLNTIESGVSSGTAGNIVPFTFNMQKNILYRGKSLVTNGDFSFTFIVPKDISFSPGPGKISYYATNGVVDAGGYYNKIVVGGGSATSQIIDNEGPQVNLFLDDKNFVAGGVTSERPVLFADLVDSSGINTVGTGIGHDISVILDANTSKPIVLNDYYESNLNSYQSGRVRYPYGKLEEGKHTLTFKVWDIQNNSTTVTSDFIVVNSAELALKHVLNYPNPFTTHTKFMFQHNQACNPLKVTVQIYTVSGKIVKTLQKSTSCEGSLSEGIDWDGRDDYGDKLGRGVYIYKLAILDVENKKAEKIEKLVILN
ncbi:type IX secretion system sortase PorU [Aurantibacillus circumpalustris]|uniref:type IX secretion system sortase PorU n=1 Tax=Aurantibacillus circumpalustris TaxID=3036359 RepID=UPI00295C0A21|nr:type IX secretion system sortase PorU [Aurantibacillus circumpalustris]